MHNTTELVCNLSFGGFLRLLDKLLWELSGPAVCAVLQGAEPVLWFQGRAVHPSCFADLPSVKFLAFVSVSNLEHA